MACLLPHGGSIRPTSRFALTLVMVHCAVVVILMPDPAMAQPPPLPYPPVPVTLAPAPPPVVVIGRPPQRLTAHPNAHGRLLGPPGERFSVPAKRLSEITEPLRPPGVINDPAAMGPGAFGAAHLHLRTGPARPTIPGAMPLPRTKTPYAYGYFGVEPQRRWTKSHGYRDRVIEWTFR